MRGPFLRTRPSQRELSGITAFQGPASLVRIRFSYCGVRAGLDQL